MIEAACVRAVSGRLARVHILSSGGCTGCCAGCAGCGTGGSDVWAKNPVGANVGNRVLILFEQRAQRLRSLLGTAAPAALFCAGYGLCAAGGVEVERCTAIGCAAFLVGAAWSACCLRRGGRLIPFCRIVEITDTDGKGNQP